MQGQQVHLSDEQLLLFSDQELPTHDANRVREHVAQCETCRRRLKAIESASSDVAELHEQDIQAHNSDSSNLRRALQARLAEISAPVGPLRAVPPQVSMGRQLASAFIALLLVASGTWALHTLALKRSSLDDIQAQASSLPRRALTPGTTRLVLARDLCASQDLDNDPPVNPSLEQAVFKEYGLPTSAEKDYALDYLISPALGGVDNIQNLWPQPYSSTWNARVKDQLEDHLHELVCQGKVQLATAQNDISSDWIAAYKRYFNTDKPEPGSSTAAGIRPGRDFDLRHRIRPESRISAVYYPAFGVAPWRLPATAVALRRTEWRR
jgi:hypothetical protein